MNFFESYIKEFSRLLNTHNSITPELLKISELIKKSNSIGNKVLIFGNGGSAAIASHVSVDLTKNAGIRCVNFNEADLITCFSNDFGYEKWVAKAIEFYGDNGDILILISSSGNSQNMLNATFAAKKKKFKSIITLSGFSKNNKLKSSGDINLWVDSKAYNLVENLHQLWLLSIVDYLIGSTEYSA